MTWRPAAWTEHAACIGHPPWLWDDPCSDHRGRLSDAAKEAVAICRTCPVRTACLEEGDRNREHGGIWGGLTPWQRGIRDQGAGRRLRDCGTKAAKDRHRVNDEPCRECWPGTGRPQGWENRQARREALEMRALGRSYGEIAQALGVARDTVAKWVQREQREGAA